MFSYKNSFYVCFSNKKISCVQFGKITWDINTDVNLNEIQDFYSDGQNIYLISGTNPLSINKKGYVQKNLPYNYGN